ncbi:hypothetical protein FOZ62_020415 [Perkinsus olseni]|uniref:Uncharacterized protein n=1 Tax=Perkinsus olseni TaxID=32597 RepID=A0A7J6Q1B5_PEROL|nr:hypothetical protein FOZ62_020415 [Perkinsus olseni]
MSAAQELTRGGFAAWTHHTLDALFVRLCADSCGSVLCESLRVSAGHAFLWLGSLLVTPSIHSSGES